MQQRINFKLATLIHCSLHNAGPQYLSSLQHPYTPSRQPRSASLNLLSQRRIIITLATRGFRHAGPSIWNSLPHHLRSTDSYTEFKSNPIQSLGQASLAPSNFYRRASDSI